MTNSRFYNIKYYTPSYVTAATEMKNRFTNRLNSRPSVKRSKHRRNCLVDIEKLTKLNILRSSRILSSKHRINLYLEKIHEIKSGYIET